MVLIMIVILSCWAVLIEMFFCRKRFDLSADTLRNVFGRRNCALGNWSYNEQKTKLPTKNDNLKPTSLHTRSNNYYYYYY